MKLCITQEDIKHLIKHAQEGYPHEVVGILAGDKDTQKIRVVRPLTEPSKLEKSEKWSKTAPEQKDPED